MSRYPIGQTVTLSTSVKDGAGALTAASAISLILRNPDGTTQTYLAIVNDDLGLYHLDLTVTDLPDSGHYAYEWNVTVAGAGDGVDYGEFDVFDPFDVAAQPVTAPLYASVDDLRAQFGDNQTGLDQTQLERALRTASRGIDDHCGRRFWQDTTLQTRTYPVADYYKPVRVSDIASKTGLIVKVDTGLNGAFASTWTIDVDFRLDPRGADQDNAAYSWAQIAPLGGAIWPLDWLGRRDTLQVTAKFGWSEIPDPVSQACLLLAAGLFKRKDAPFGVAGFNEFGAVRVRDDPAVEKLLFGYVRSASASSVRFNIA